MGRYNIRGRQKMKTMNRMVFAVAGASMLGLAAYMIIFINTSQVSTSNAGLFKNMMLGYDLNTGDVIASYTFEGEVLKAEQGPDAIEVSQHAASVNGGADNTRGLTPGAEGRPVHFAIPAVKELNFGGIDVSLDYRRSEATCSFFSRGNYFSFGIKDGKLAVLYKVNQENKKAVIINEVTRYEIPEDEEFRNYRFIYDPANGRGEIFVNGVAVWSHESEPQSNLSWKDEDPLVMGKNLKGDGTSRAFIDNVLVKATRQVSKLPVTLLNFEARTESNKVMITWYTATETDIDTFIVERSLNSKDYIEIGRVKAAGNSTSLIAYALIDPQPAEGLAYYRLSPSNKPLKSMTISLIGHKYKNKQQELKVGNE
jgi:hypothetical protein